MRGPANLGRNRQVIDDFSKELNSTAMLVELTPAAAQQFAKLPRVIRARVTRLLERLEKWPAVSGAKPLKGSFAGKFRIRTGDYRLQFHLTGGSVVVERIGLDSMTSDVSRSTK